MKNERKEKEREKKRERERRECHILLRIRREHWTEHNDDDDEKNTKQIS